VTAIAGYKVTISFTKPNDNGSPITSYIITVYNSNGGGTPYPLVPITTFTESISEGSTIVTLTSSAMTAGAVHKFTVTAKNIIGTSPESAMSLDSVIISNPAPNPSPKPSPNPSPNPSPKP
jgi:hypothetical protein